MRWGLFFEMLMVMLGTWILVPNPMCNHRCTTLWWRYRVKLTYSAPLPQSSHCADAAMCGGGTF